MSSSTARSTPTWPKPSIISLDCCQRRSGQNSCLDNPDYPIRLNNLGRLLQATNRLDEAGAMFRRGLMLNEQIYGPDHPNVAKPLNNLARLLQATNRLPEAELMMRRT